MLLDVRAFLKIIKKPYLSNLYYTLSIWFFIVIPYIVRAWVLNSSLSWVLYQVILFYVLAYLLSFFTGWHRKIQYLLLLILILFFPLNVFSGIRFGCILSPNIFSSLLATNTEELKEFIKTYVSYSDIFGGLLILLVSFLIVLFYHKYDNRLPRLPLLIPFSVLFFSIGALVHNPEIVRQSFSKYSFWAFNTDDVADLTRYRQTPPIVSENLELPRRIVIIIGESFARSHSSLYGYSQETNPRLQKFADSGNLTIYSQCQTPACYTTEAFKYILNTHLLSDKSAKKWYQSITLMDILKQLGYRTYWISNQEEKGLYDNLSSGFSKLCDVSFFAPKRGFDDWVLSQQYLVDDSDSLQCVFYHLMGQHFSFSSRFPQETARFVPSNYEAYSVAQRSVIADYDNATLFNDYVVSSIFQHYSKQESLAFYFPDHGLDLYDVDEEYYGHARLTVPASVEVARNIPFVVYYSDSLLNSFPELIDRVKDYSNDLLCTDHFVLYFLDLLGSRLEI